MNKKVFVIAILTLAFSMMATSLTSTVKAQKTIVTYEASGGEGRNYLWIPPDVIKYPPGPDMDIPEPGGLRIAKGTYRAFRGVNPILGPTEVTNEAIISVQHYSVEITRFPDGSYFPTAGWGHGIYRVLYNVTSGSYMGTLEGFSIVRWSWNLTEHSWTDNWWNATYHRGTGGLEGVKMNVEGYARGTNYLSGGWVRVEIIFP